MNSGGFVLACHGCDREPGERILAGLEHLRPSTNSYDWLGSGAYFWENSARRAFDWAEFLRSRPEYARTSVKAPFALGAIINPGRCLDLTDAHCLGILRSAYNEFAAFIHESGAELPANEPGCG